MPCDPDDLKSVPLFAPLDDDERAALSRGFRFSIRKRILLAVGRHERQVTGATSQTSEGLNCRDITLLIVESGKTQYNALETGSNRTGSATSICDVKSDSDACRASAWRI